MSIGIKHAINFADIYEAKRLLCRLVFDAGKEYYSYIHDGVQKWGLDFLETAIEVIYS